MIFVVKTTHECNLRCAYCFGNRHQSASTHDIRPVIDRIVEMATGSKIILHGGEPLLTPVEHLDYVFSRIPSGKRSLQTNLTLMTMEHVDLFRRYGVTVGTSFDGLGELGRHRGRQEQVHENIKALLQAGIRVGVIAVLTGSNAGTTQRVDALWEQITALGCNFKFNYGIGFDQIPPDDFADLSLRLFRRAIPLIIEHGRNIRPFVDYLANLTGLLPIPSDCSFSGCQIHRQVMGVMPNGDVTFCCRYTDSPVIGNVFSHSLEELVANPIRDSYLARYDSLRKRQCQGCEAFPVCYGGCLGEIDPTTGVTFHCQATRGIVRYVLSGAMEKDFPGYDFVAWGQKHVATLTGAHP